MDKRWAPNENYKVTAVPLDGGLDFVSPPSMVKPGTLTDCLNYEVVDRNGYRRIDGFFQWDNAFKLEDDRLFEVVLSNYVAPVNAGKGDFVWSQEHLASRNAGGIGPFGVIYSLVDNEDGTGVLSYWRINSKAEPTVGGSFDVRTLTSGGLDVVGSFSTQPTPAAILPRVDLGTASNFGSTSYGPAGRMIKYKDQSGGNVSTTETGGPAITGLHYFNDVAYAVIDSMRVSMTSTVPLYAGDVVGDSAQAFILLNPVNTSGNTWVSDATYLHSGGYLQDSGMTAQFGPTPPTTTYVARLPSTSVTGFTILSEDTSEGRGSFGILHRAYSISSINKNKPRPINAITVTNAGTGYTVPPIVGLSGGNGFGAKAVAIVNSGSIVAAPVTSGGTFYTFGSGAPSVSITGVGSSGAASTTALPWEYAGWRAVNTGWTFDARNVRSASGVLPKVDRTRGPNSQVSAYTTGNVSGVPYGLLNRVIIDGSNTTLGVPTDTTAGATALQATGSSTVNLQFRTVDIFGQARSPTLGAFSFATLREQIPSGALISGLEFKITYNTVGVDSLTPPGTSDVSNYKARACLFRHGNLNDPNRTDAKLGDFREVSITPSTSNETGVTVTIGSSTDIWGTQGLTIDDITGDVGVAFDIGMQVPSGVSWAYSFQIDKVELTVHYRSAAITYYFASGTATERNVLSATLVSYNNESGELVQGDWKGNWQVADLGVEKYCASGSVGLVKITNGGSGYTSAPTVTFADPSTGGESGAAGTAIIQDGSVVGVVVTNGGTGYTSATTVTFSAPPAGVTATGTVVVGALPGIQSGMGIYLDSNLTTRIGFVSSDMTYNGLDSYTAIEEAESRYQIISANFYADEAWEGIYGVSGAGRAWYFDGSYFSRIYAIPLKVDGSATKDKPRHICNYRFHLALGYKSGSVQFSKIGEPENFDFVLGATEVGIGDRVTGIFPLPGQYLAVFCENSIWGITGKTTPEFSLENISPYSGAIEYSVVAIGDKPIYCDTMGISTLEQSDKYGNFLGTRLSHKVSPWLLPRLTKEASNNYGIIAAYPVRAKNQYRVWFKDGYQLVMSFVGPEQEPQFTLTNYILGGTQDESGTPPADGYETVIITQGSDKPHLLAVCSEVDSYGQEQIMFSLDTVKSRILENSNTSIRNFVYKADYTNQFGTYVAIAGLSGLTFLPKPFAIPAYFQTAFSTVENPFFNKSIRKLRLEGTSRGVATISVATDYNYTEPDFASDVLVDVSLNKPEQLPLTNPTIYKAASRVGNVAETGRVIVVLLGGTSETKKKVLDGTAIGFKKIYYSTRDTATNQGSWHYCEPAHYVQLMLIQYEEGRQDA